jgi:hypothetical protein
MAAARNWRGQYAAGPDADIKHNLPAGLTPRQVDEFYAHINRLRDAHDSPPSHVAEFRALLLNARRRFP